MDNQKIKIATNIENAVADLNGIASILCMLSVAECCSYKNGEEALGLLANQIWKTSDSLGVTLRTIRNPKQ